MAETPPKVLLRSEESGGHIAIVELIGGGRPPLHHHDFDETFYVFEGELTFHLGDDVVTGRSGEPAFAPRGVPHTYANPSGASSARGGGTSAVTADADKRSAARGQTGTLQRPTGRI